MIVQGVIPSLRELAIQVKRSFLRQCDLKTKGVIWTAKGVAGQSCNSSSPVCVRYTLRNPDLQACPWVCSGSLSLKTPGSEHTPASLQRQRLFPWVIVSILDHLRPGRWRPRHEQSLSKQIWILNFETTFQMHSGRAGRNGAHGRQEQGQGSLVRTDQGIPPGDNSKHETSDSPSGCCQICIINLHTHTPQIYQIQFPGEPDQGSA